MQDQFIPYELAVKLKELGFDKGCFSMYIGTHFKSRCYGSIHDYENKELFTPAPLWQQAFDWFREKGLHSWIYQSNRYSFHYTILKDGRYAKNGSNTIHYQEARQACLEKLIELCQK